MASFLCGAAMAIMATERLVFDPRALTLVPSSPFVISRVEYWSDTDRVERSKQLLGKWADATAKASLSDDKLHLAAHAALTVIKIFALTTKHIGFSEEAEWRVVYFLDRDRNSLLKQFMSYHIGERGVVN
jgi:hypothetical protein